MSSVKSTLGRKAAKAVVVHSAHGVTAKAKREPVRASRLLALGALIGAAAGFFAGKTLASGKAPDTATPPPVSFPPVVPPVPAAAAPPIVPPPAPAA